MAAVGTNKAKCAQRWVLSATAAGKGARFLMAALGLKERSFLFSQAQPLAVYLVAEVIETLILVTFFNIVRISKARRWGKKVRDVTTNRCPSVRCRLFVLNFSSQYTVCLGIHLC